jgi:hypothetical protein
MGRLVTFP